jgi:AcrR family transcriptional regulator
MDTKTKILNAAERLFGDRGIEGTSLRAITQEAGVNLAAVNYHFQSKESLLQAAIDRRIQPINGRRLELLSKLIEQHGENKTLPVEGLLDAVLRPVFEAAFRPADEGAIELRRLIGRMFADPEIRPKLMLKEALGETLMIFSGQFQRSLPNCAPRDLWWGMYFSIGSMAHSLTSGPLITSISGGLCNPADWELQLELIIRYASAGLRALESGISPIGENKND